MRIVYCEQGKRAVVKVVRKDTKNLKSLLGSCEPLYVSHPFASRELCLVLSEPGEYESDPPVNRIIPDENDPDYEYIINGSFFICEGREENGSYVFSGLTPEDAEELCKKMNKRAYRPSAAKKSVSK